MTRAALLLLVGALGATIPAHAEPTLGRLFFTPERRAVLERQRQSNVQETRTLEGASLSLEGAVVRSSGKRTHWINGRPQDEKGSELGVGVATSAREPGRAVLTVGEEAPADLRVGESINRATREAKDGLEGGSVTVKRAPPRPGAPAL